jgi:hypothetical protein
MTRAVLAGLAVLAAGLLPAAPAAAQDPPCDAASPPAAVLAGVPQRVAYGESRSARLAPGQGGADLARAVIVVGDDPPVVVRGPDATADEAPYSLDLDAPPLTVRLTTTEVARSTGARCERVTERRVRGVRRIEAGQSCFASTVRPRRVAPCGVDGRAATNLRWRRWNRDVARGRGRWQASCPPFPARTCAPPVPARVALSRIRWCSNFGSYIYTRMRVDPDAGKAFGVALSCPQVASSGPS